MLTYSSTPTCKLCGGKKAPIVGGQHLDPKYCKTSYREVWDAAIEAHQKHGAAFSEALETATNTKALLHETIPANQMLAIIEGIDQDLTREVQCTR